MAASAVPCVKIGSGGTFWLCSNSYYSIEDTEDTEERDSSEFFVLRFEFTFLI
jgi:hypothetical protein